MINNHKLRIGVLMGGMSIEREVSFNSGRTVCDHLDSSIYTVIPIFQKDSGALFLLPWHFLHRGKIADFYHRLDQEARNITWDDLPSIVDFIYLTLHGRRGEDGSIQGILEILGIPYLGSKVTASALSMNKYVQQSLLQHHGFSTPKTLCIPPSDIETLTPETIQLRRAEAHLEYPLIVKPAEEGSSLGISIATNDHEIIPAIKHAMTISPGISQPVLIQEKIMGMEFVCVGIQEQDGTWSTLPITEVVLEEGSTFYDYEQKYMPGRATKITPARCSYAHQATIQATSTTIFNLFNFSTIARIDGFLTDDERIIILDCNSIPGMAPATFVFHQAAEVGMNHTTLINRLIHHELVNYELQLPSSTRNDLDQKPLIRVAVLLGGASNERETSLDSGRNICYKLSPDRYIAIPIFVSETMKLYQISERLLLQNSTREISAQLDHAHEIHWSDLPKIADFVFIGLHGGAGENGSVQGFLEMLGLPYNGSGILASAICMNKARAKELLINAGLHVPTQHLLAASTWRNFSPEARTQFCNTVSETLGLPLIVKPNDDGCSVMVSKVAHVEDLKRQIDLIFSHKKEEVLIEEFVQGMELTCGVIGNESVCAFPPSHAISAGDILSIEEKFLPGHGENQTPAPLPPAATKLVQQSVEHAFKALGCRGYARFDGFYQTADQNTAGTERIVFLECNTLPALTPATCLFHQAAEIGIPPMELINTIIELGFAAHQHRPCSLTTTQPTHRMEEL